LYELHPSHNNLYGKINIQVNYFNLYVDECFILQNTAVLKHIQPINGHTFRHVYLFHTQAPGVQSDDCIVTPSKGKKLLKIYEKC
jgi:hypothetical protein